jgi:outer membrane lipoprotein-sorting protein
VRSTLAACAVTVLLGTLCPPASSGQPSTDPMTWSAVVERYASVHDYTCRYEKVERAISNGEPQTINLSYRKPLDVRMEWLGGNGKVDQVAVYRQGQNDGKLIAHKGGMLGSMVGTVHLDIHDSRAMADSRHPVTEVGLGYIIERAEREIRTGRVTVGPAAQEPLEGRPQEPLEGRPSVRFELSAAAGASVFGIEGARRAVIWVDAELQLPVKVEILDAQGTALERHRFKEIRLNVGLTDAVFTL